MERVAAFIVDKRNIIFLIYIAAAVFCIFSSGWVEVSDSLTKYLPESTETQIGLELMDDEFTTFGTARIVVENVSYEQAEKICADIERVPGVKEVVFMLVFFAVFLFLIQNSFDLMQAVYQVVQLAIDRVTGLFGTGSELDLSEVSITTTDDDVAALLAMLVVALVSWVVVIVAYVVALVVSWARAIQIYVMAAFSPIPLALISLDETRQMGVGYLKNFAAVCLAGVIILVLLVSFPIVLGGLDAASAGVPVVDSIVGGLSYALQYLAMCVLLILSLVKSGSWARDILGG